MDWRRLIPGREVLLANRWLRWLTPWLGHPKLWHWSRRGVALGVSLGVFFGLLIPLGQIPVTAAAAIVLRANLPVAAASTLISNPVTYAPLYYSAYRLGAWVTGESKPPLEDEALRSRPVADRTIWQRVSALGKPLLVGLTIMACLAGALTYLLIDLFWRWCTGARWCRRNSAD